MISHRYAVKKESPKDKVQYEYSSSELSLFLSDTHSNLQPIPATSLFDAVDVPLNCLIGVGAWKILYYRRGRLSERNGWVQGQVQLVS